MNLGTFIHFSLLFFPIYPCQNMTNMNMIGPGSREESGLDGLPPHFPELLSESKQQEVDSQFASPKSQASKEITMVTGHIQVKLVLATV